MFIVSNLVGSTIQITTLPLPVLSTLQAVCHLQMNNPLLREGLLTQSSLDLCSIPYAHP